jgi:hypothetical protein
VAQSDIEPARVLVASFAGEYRPKTFRRIGITRDDATVVQRCKDYVDVTDGVALQRVVLDDEAIYLDGDGLRHEDG